MKESTTAISPELSKMRQFYQGGETRPAEFRIAQLKKLRDVILSHEAEIYAALYADLKKGKEETYASEIGIVLAEISFVCKHLKKWMRPQKVKTNLLNFPSKAHIYRDPLGVVLIIGSWNYPFQLVLLPLIGAIAGGNCAVIKPSEGAPATSAILHKLLHAAFPEEYIQVQEGEGEIIIPQLMDSFRFDHIFYTGSGAVGKLIYKAAARQLIPVTLELGGKSPVVVEEDADVKTAAKRIVSGKFLNAGQTCVAPDYILVHHRVREELIREMGSSIEKFYGTNAAESGEYGKIINENRFDTLKAYLQNGKIAYGGESNRADLFIAPTILTDVSMEDPVMKEEIFGPILPVISFSDSNEALHILQGFDHPLSFYVFTKSKQKSSWWMKNFTFGGGCINNTIWHLTNPHLPFGGVGGSGIGRYHGKYSFETFTHAKSVLSTPVWFDPAMKYPPYAGRLNFLKKIFK